MRQVARLSVFRRRLDEFDLLVTVQPVEAGRRKFRGKISQVPADELAGFVRLLEVEHIVVPIEHGLACIVQFAEQAVFHLVQYVESDEYISFIRQLFHTERVCHFAVEHPLVGDSLRFQTLLVLPVDFAQRVPHQGKPALQSGIVLDGEVVEELADCLFLFILHEVEALGHVVEVFQVAEKRIGICHILVGVVEVAYHHFAPEIEVVKRLVAARDLNVRSVEVAHQLHRIADEKARRLSEQFADAQVGRRPEWLLRFFGEVFVEKQSGAFVREDYCRAAQFASGLFKQVVRH